MTFIELFLLALSLAMDCFAVSCSTGVTQPGLEPKYVLFFAFCFGFFQAGMPVIGWFCGEAVVMYLSRFTNWIAFVILAFIGGKMIWEGIRNEEDESKTDMTKLGTVMLLSVATSIDALAVGFGFSMMQNVRIWWAVFVIGIVSFIVSIVGFSLAKKLSKHIRAHIATIIGGAVLLAIGIKILIGF